MELNTRASTTILNQHTYSESRGKLAGIVSVPIKYGNHEAELSALVIHGQGQKLFGCNWRRVIKVNWSQIFRWSPATSYQVLEKHKNVFQEGSRTLNSMEAKIYVDGKASPWYFKARPVPYALKKGVEDEFKRLEKEEIVSQLPCSNCTSGESQRSCQNFLWL